MKTRVSRLMALILVLGCMLLMLPGSVQASAPEPLTINAELLLTGENSAAGSFGTTGLFTTSGTASEEFFIAGGTIHGVKTLVGMRGTITIKFQAQLTWTGLTTGEAEGRFVIVSGTGAYEKLHGVGVTYAQLDLSTYHISASYTGIAHFD
jgi:hypothetical protein